MKNHKNKRIDPASKTSGKSGVRVIPLILLALLGIFLLLNSYRKKSNSESTTTFNDIPFKTEGEVKIYRQSLRDTLQLQVEIADNISERAQGMMYRRSLPEQSGMFFIFETEEEQSFWMRNTYLPLDIIYINAQGVIVSIITHTVPFSETGIPSGKPAKYVLETKAGFTIQQEIQVGDSVFHQKY